MKPVHVTLLAGGMLLAFFSACNHPGAAVAEPAGAPLDWTPRLKQPIVQLEEILADLEQQQPKNFTISNIGFLYDAELYVMFTRYVDRLEGPERDQEIATQREWLVKREKAVRAAYDEFTGGTLAAYMAGQKSIELTRERIGEIETETIAR